MDPSLEKILTFFADLKIFLTELGLYLINLLHLSFIRFEAKKGAFVVALYRQRGKLARRLIHTGMAGIAALGISIAPVVAQEFPGRDVDPWNLPFTTPVLSLSNADTGTQTLISEHGRDKIFEYEIKEGDSVSSISQKFDISEDTIRWQNNLKSKETIKAGQKLEILPITGVSHKVQKGDTVYSISKKYDSVPQAVVDFPYNTFTNYETFELAIGQVIIVPDGIKPAEILWNPIARVRQITPDAGTVTALGIFVWPANGSITQNFVWYHKGVDIANKSTPAVLAADSGQVTLAGWPDGSGYGNRVIIDHGNGYKTLYAHLSRVFVTQGQTVNRGDRIGQMGNTGRSTGPHLHFEVIKDGVHINPLSILR
ncbi:MAG: M23 family metallopeptidase [Patescibacteria group bacterium]